MILKGEKMSDKADKIKLISIFHYVVGGIMAVFSFFPLIHILMGVLMLTGVLDGENPQEAPSKFLGIIFIVFPAMFILLGLTLSTLIIVSGCKLSKFKSRMFCLIIACIQCLFMPFGTVLGIFTIILLMDDEVIQMFKDNTQLDKM